MILSADSEVKSLMASWDKGFCGGSGAFAGRVTGRLRIPEARAALTSLRLSLKNSQRDGAISGLLDKMAM